MAAREAGSDSSMTRAMGNGRLNARTAGVEGKHGGCGIGKGKGKEGRKGDRWAFVCLFLFL